MYLHLGQETIIKISDIIGIFDIDNTTISKSTKHFLALAQQRGQVINITDELPKTFVLCHGLTGNKVYISQISSATLRKRTKYIEYISNI